MFPSSNLFRDIPCPFFSRVSCPRPHCHFKHVQTATTTTTTTTGATNSSVTSTSSTPTISIPPDANETLNKLITQLSSAAGNSALNSTTMAPVAAPAVDLTSLLQNTLLQSLSSVLANALNGPGSQPKTANESMIAVSPVTASTSENSSAIPEYRPTPIAELERRKRIQQTTVSRPIVKEESEDYVEATFSPPSSAPPSPPETVEKTKASVSNLSQTITTNSQPSSTPHPLPKPSPTVADENHSWVTPPLRRAPSSSAPTIEKTKIHPSSSSTSSSSSSIKSNKVINQPVSPVKFKPIPKKPMTSKVRLADIDLDRVPVTSSISLDVDSDRKTQPLKRPSNGTTDSPPQKKVKQNVSSTAAQPILKRTTSITNGTSVDAELALFDEAFSTPKPIAPPNRIQQLAARYSSTSTTISTSTSTTITATASATNRTRAETSTDGRRIAHQPKANLNTATAQPAATSALFQPLIDTNSSSGKIPYKTRQEYLKFFFNELKKSSKNPDSTPTAPLLARAQTIEKEIFDRSTNKNSYLNLAAKHLRQLRTTEAAKSEATVPIKKPTTQRMVVSHSSMLVSGQVDNASFGVKKVKQIDPKTLTDSELYTVLITYKASEQDLLENGYPAFSLDFPGKVLIKSRNPLYNSTIKPSTSDPTIRICCRCGKTYRVTPEGEYMTTEECWHHWGRLRPQRVGGQLEKKYSCCSSNAEAIGCTPGKCHVHEGDDTQLLSGYVKTQPLKKALTADQSYGIYALDCEMCYTINGLELVRVSVINHKLGNVYETFVKPDQKILDYNTRWSGITEKDITNCPVRLKDVQRHLLQLFNDKTILIGHSLESDLKALKIVHETIIDTSLVFPHAKGKPFKRALKNLASECLTKIIQESADGHDSVEDAKTCMELMLWKIKQELKSTATISNR